MRYAYISGSTAIWVRDTVNLRVPTHGRRNSFGINSLPWKTNEISNTERRVLFGGNFEAGSFEWGMPQLDSRGKHILEMAVKQDLLSLT